MLTLEVLREPPDSKQDGMHEDATCWDGLTQQQPSTAPVSQQQLDNEPSASPAPYADSARSLMTDASAPSMHSTHSRGASDDSAFLHTASDSPCLVDNHNVTTTPRQTHDMRPNEAVSNSPAPMHPIPIPVASSSPRIPNQSEASNFRPFSPPQQLGSPSRGPSPPRRHRSFPRSREPPIVSSLAQPTPAAGDDVICVSSPIKSADLTSPIKSADPRSPVERPPASAFGKLALRSCSGTLSANNSSTAVDIGRAKSAGVPDRATGQETSVRSSGGRLLTRLLGSSKTMSHSLSQGSTGLESSGLTSPVGTNRVAGDSAHIASGPARMSLDKLQWSLSEDAINQLMKSKDNTTRQPSIIEKQMDDAAASLRGEAPLVRLHIRVQDRPRRNQPLSTGSTANPSMPLGTVSASNSMFSSQLAGATAAAPRVDLSASDPTVGLSLLTGGAFGLFGSPDVSGKGGDGGESKGSWLLSKLGWCRGAGKMALDDDWTEQVSILAG